MIKWSRCQKVALNGFEQPVHFEQVLNKREEYPEMTLYMLGLNSRPMDIDKLFCNEVLSNNLYLCLDLYQ